MHEWFNRAGSPMTIEKPILEKGAEYEQITTTKVTARQVTVKLALNSKEE